MLAYGEGVRKVTGGTRARRLSTRPRRSRCRAPGSGLRSPVQRLEHRLDDPARAYQQDAPGSRQAPCASGRNGGAPGGCRSICVRCPSACLPPISSGETWPDDALRRGLGRWLVWQLMPRPDSHRARLPALAREDLRAGRSCIVRFESAPAPKRSPRAGTAGSAPDSQARRALCRNARTG